MFAFNHYAILFDHRRVCTQTLARTSVCMYVGVGRVSDVHMCINSLKKEILLLGYIHRSISYSIGFMMLPDEY